MMPAYSRLACLLAVATLATLRPEPAQAEIYRCTIDGQLTFRDAPCPGQPATPPNAPMQAGCYLVDAPGWESGRQTFTMKISGTGIGRYLFTEPGDPSNTKLPMRIATADELRTAAKVLDFAPDAALVIEVPKDTPNMPQVSLGLYRGRNPYRDTTYFFLGYLANGVARPVACP